MLFTLLFTTFYRPQQPAPVHLNAIPIHQYEPLSSTMPSSSVPTEGPYPGIYKGQVFGDMDDAQQQVTMAIIKAHHSFYTQKKNPGVWHIICRDKAKENNHDCPFKVRVVAKDGGFQLVSLEEHTCPSSVHIGWRVPNSTKFLVPHHIDSVRADHRLKPQHIQDNERLQHAHRISYMQAHRTKKQCRREIDGDRDLQFQLIKPILHAMYEPSQPPEIKGDSLVVASHDGAGFIGFSRKDDNTFKGAMVIPYACINAFPHCRRLVCFDGGHMKSGGGVLYVATTLDPNEEILPLVWAIGETRVPRPGNSS